MWDWTSIEWLCSEQLSPCWPTRAAYVPASSPGAPAVFAACGFLFFAAMIHLDISSSQTAFIARSVQRLPRHAMQVGSGMAMRAVRELGTLWKRGLQVSQCHSASNFSESAAATEGVSATKYRLEFQSPVLVAPEVYAANAASVMAHHGIIWSNCHCFQSIIAQVSCNPVESCASSQALDSHGTAFEVLACDFAPQKSSLSILDFSSWLAHVP